MIGIYIEYTYLDTFYGLVETAGCFWLSMEMLLSPDKDSPKEKYFGTSKMKIIAYLTNI